MNEKVEVTPEIKENMEQLIDYMWDEYKNYIYNENELDEETKKTHVWYFVRTIGEWMGIDMSEYSEELMKNE